MKRLAVGAALVVAASFGTLAAPASAAPACSSLFCFSYGPSSATVWTNIGLVSGTVTVQSPVLGLVPLPPR